MTQPRLTIEIVRELAGDQTFDRGYRYYRDGTVSDVIRRGNLIQAQVQGSDFHPYRVQIEFDDGGVAAVSCTCPYEWGGICKHAVATLLVYLHDPKAITEKPTLDARLADFTAEQLRQIMLGLASLGPEIVEAIEREISWLQQQTATPGTPAAAAEAVQITGVRREIRRAFYEAGRVDPYEFDYDGRYEAMEIEPEEILDPHLERVLALLDNGETAAAAAVMAAVMDAFADGLSGLDNYLYEFNDDAFYVANMTLDTALAEVLLSLALDTGEQAVWLKRIAGWEEELGELEASRTALTQGWSFPSLAAILRGDQAESGLWPVGLPDYADDLALARLRILARQGRRQEYISLATAVGQTKLAALMLANIGQIDRAVAAAKAEIASPAELLEIAVGLAAAGDLDSALELATHGLSLDPEERHPAFVHETSRLKLARWTRDQALAAGGSDLALRAAQFALRESGSLRDFLAVRETAGERWPEIRPGLLKMLPKTGSISNQLDIYLHENMLDEAMAAVDKNRALMMDADLHRVVEAARATRPDWGIGRCRAEAEAIMDEGRARDYDTAVSWLRDARVIYEQHGRLAEWERYLDGLLQNHHRKYKLVPMLRRIR